MISSFRRYLSTWVVRLLFLLLVISFAIWGVGDVIRMIGHETWVAKVGNRTIEVPELQDAYQRQIAELTRRNRGQFEPTPEMRRSILSQTLDRLLIQSAVMQEAEALGLAMPDEAVRQAVYDIPAFHGPDGRFDMNVFQTALRTSGLTEPRLVALVRADLANRQLLEAVRAGSEPPASLVRLLFDFQNEKRSADLVDLPFAAVAEPAAPADTVLQRWWENHPDIYSSPEYRRIKAVILSPETLAKGIEVTDEELHAAYDRLKSEFVQPEKRSAQVITVADAAKAKAMADEWRGGADWARMQQAAKEAGGAAIELEKAAQPEFPSPELGEAVFKTEADHVSDPVQGPFGWAVVRVTNVTPASETSFDAAKDKLRERVAAEKAADRLYDSANKLDRLLANGTSFDELPDDLGLAAVTGTLDAKGDAKSGAAAPIPGPPALRDALIQSAFQMQKGEPPRLEEVQLPGGGSAYYAASVEDVTPPAQQPFDEVKDRVLADWRTDAIRRQQEEAAARLLTAVKGGQSLADAAAAAGLTVRRTPLAGRADPAGGPPQLMQAIFTAKPGDPTMVETPEGFIVAVPAETQVPDPGGDPVGYGRLQEAVTRSLANDTEVVFASALRDRAQPRVNQQVFNSLIQP